MRSPNSTTDFTVTVDGIGLFVFGRRKMADHMRINVEYARLTESVDPTPWLDTVATWLSALKVLMVRAPEGFELDELDPLDDVVYLELSKVYTALRAKEDSFRGKPNVSGESASPPAGPDPGVLVPPQIQPAGNGPALP